ncbi:hypothetical protein C1645_816524 [Glomus cerebriforme]|uniref:Galactose oxidase n=1 Tax=Glomus cerebriforme TaxID=658196 RepID=A0A397TE32_9GLOM|nr:hypothetical protein C1645_816524 [Glomus cerebriforme]
MLSAQHTSTEVQPAADHALLYFLYAEGRLGKPNFIHYKSQPSRSTKLFKRAEDESVVPKVRFGQTTTVIDDRVILIGGCETTDGVLPSNLLVLNSTSLNVNEQTAKLPVSGHGAAPIRGSRILITFGIQTMAPQRTFATPIQEIDVNTMNISSFQLLGEVPQQRYDHTTTKIDDDKIIIYGGKNKDEVILGDIFYIDLNLNSWNFIEQPSHPIAGHSSMLINNYLISCFGVDANAKVTNDCKIFDISTNTFIQSIINEQPPIPRTLSSMVSLEDNKSVIYIFGGIDENGNGLNDLYKLDTSNAPTLSWSPINVYFKTTDSKLIPSGRGAHSAFTNDNTDIMTIWGGISNGNQLADPNFYFFDIKGSMWVDETFYKNAAQPITLDDIKRPDSTIYVTIFGIIGTVVLTLGFIVLFIIRRRKILQKFQRKEINNDPYGRSDQFGSNTYLINDLEAKQVQLKIIDEQESVPEPTPQPASTLPLTSPSPPTNVEKEVETSNNCQPNNSIMPTTSPKRMSFGKLPALTNTGATSETQRMKRTHKRTSSVSLTSSELANIARSRNFTHHKSSLSTSSLNRSSLNNSYQNSRKSLSNILGPVSEKSSNLDNHRSSERSVNSIQWVGFSNSMINDQEENRDALHVRNLSSKQQKNSSKYYQTGYSSDGEDDEYTINGDYIDTTSVVKVNYNRNIFDHDEVITTYDVSQIKNGPQCYNIPKQGHISAASNKSTSRESGVIDKFTHESPSNSNESSDIDRASNEEDKGSSMKKSKRSSKRISRVSFALKDEKIEFDENESSSTVSLTRMSGRSLSSQSSSSSSAPSIIEEEVEESEPLEDYYTPLRPNSILNKSFHDDEESSLSGFSF